MASFFFVATQNNENWRKNLLSSHFSSTLNCQVLTVFDIISHFKFKSPSLTARLNGHPTRVHKPNLADLSCVSDNELTVRCHCTGLYIGQPEETSRSESGRRYYSNMNKNTLALSP